MLFSQPTFLFAFLPLVALLHAVAPRALRSPLLLAASLFFYAWGEGRLVLLLALSIAFNHAVGRALVRARESTSSDEERARRERRVVALAVVLNLATLFVFKYAGWLLTELAAVTNAEVLDSAARWSERHLTLPLGISFFTFQAISFVVDLARRDAEAPRGALDFGVYIALFPQLVAGPIVRYRDLAHQLRKRRVTLAGSAEGIRRFLIGLAKKVLVADVVGAPADAIFALEPSALTPTLAWTGCLCYTLQIYFDFSGYSDMAIGIGKMLGFTLPENFRHPYASRSVTEFWRRWHISLSTWFRDYLYIPLGGNRRGPVRTFANLWIVFLLCGLWHGAAWTFLVWGALHGALLVVERAGLGRGLARAPGFVARAWTLVAVMIGWVFFRADGLGAALDFLSAMAGRAGELGQPVALHLDRYELATVVAGMFLSLPLAGQALERWRERSPRTGELAEFAVVVTLGALAVSSLAAQSSTPFLYFRF